MCTTLELDRDPILAIIVGPFASGKNAVVEDLVSHGLVHCITATTRPPREGEVDGVDYHFMSRSRFTQLLARKAFVESEETNDHLYGTLETPIMDAFKSGKDVVMHLDVRGVRSLQTCAIPVIRNSIESFYLEVDLETCVRRARARPGGMPDSEIVKRAITREREEKLKHVCRHRIPNPDGAFNSAKERILLTIARRRKESLAIR